MRTGCLLLLMMGLLLVTGMSHADSGYTNYEHLEMSRGKLLRDYTDGEYREYYPHVDKRRFFGWRVHTVHKNVKVSYVTETLFSYYNDGFTAIDYKYKLDTQSSSKFSLSATGSIGIKTTRGEASFRNNLDGSLRLSSDYQVSRQEREIIDIALKIDPGTQVDLYIYGEGRITNGVAAYYIFWMRFDRGGYEVFVVTTQYQRLEKKQI